MYFFERYYVLYKLSIYLSKSIYVSYIYQNLLEIHLDNLALEAKISIEQKSRGLFCFLEERERWRGSKGDDPR